MLRQSVITGLLAKSKPQANSNPIKISNNPGPSYWRTGYCYKKSKKHLTIWKSQRFRLERNFKKVTSKRNYPDTLKKTSGYHIPPNAKSDPIHAKFPCKFHPEPKTAIWKAMWENTLHEQSEPACGAAVAIPLWTNGGNCIYLCSAARKTSSVDFEEILCWFTP